MHYSKLTMLIPCVLLLSACTTVTPAYKDNDPHTGSCVRGGPDNVVQQFYDYCTQHRGNDTTALRPYSSDKLATLPSGASHGNSRHELLSSSPFPGRTTLSDSAHITSASTIPSRNARNIPLHVDLKQSNQGWQDEVLVIQEGQCWVTDDVCYLGGNVHAMAGTLRQSIGSR